ncbi:MAG: uracil-DNA glycosylase [Alphaproteobacteria bacterium]|nr:uracil-DNA glycosylase [Alphaproteobacteria bacterium]
MSDTLSTLNWLVEAGADEAVAEEPVNRLTAKSAVQPLQAPPPASVPRPMAPARAPAPVVEGDAIGGAMAAAASAMSLAELQAALEAFDGCALKRTATNTVFADGVASGRILLIGEAPGRDEDRVGKPFVGRAGHLLDKMLASIGLDRRTNAYITNVINWRPPDNRDPTPEEAAACLPFLRRHIELADPEIIILLGAVAARHVVGISDGIMKLRGRWLEYRVGMRMVPLMPTLHPAYLLRQPAHKKLAWRDLQAVRDKMQALGLPAAATQSN